MTAPTASISAAASTSRSPTKRASSPAARAFMAAATGSAWVRSSSASTACAATSRASRSPSAPISSGCDPADNQTDCGRARSVRYEPAPADIPSGLTLAGTYTREVRAGIERIWENVLDWEHLPALHEVYFSRVALIDIGSWGWRIELT